MIKGVLIKPLKKIKDDRGVVAHMLRCDDAVFKGFGEVYFSYVYPGKIKGWHLHTKMTLNYAVVRGIIKLVLFDNREKSPTKGKLVEIETGDNNYCLITIPPFIWNGFSCLNKTTAIVANCVDLPHDPQEIRRMSPFDRSIIDYDWKVNKSG